MAKGDLDAKTTAEILGAYTGKIAELADKVATAVGQLDQARSEYKKPEKQSWNDILKETLKHNIFKIIIGIGCIVSIILVIFNENLVIKIGGFEAKSCKQQNLKLENALTHS